MTLTDPFVLLYASLMMPEVLNMKHYPKYASGVAAVMFLSVSSAMAAGMLTAKNDMTLYTFDKDKAGKSACYDNCAVNWPPYMAAKGDKMMKDWTMVERRDGTMQWAYDGKPLYFFKNDKKTGDAKGDGAKGIWHVIKE